MTQSPTSPPSSNDSPSPWNDALRAVQLLNLVRSSNTTELNTRATLRSAWGDNLKESLETEEMRVNSPTYHLQAAAPETKSLASTVLKWGIVAGASAIGLGAPATAVLYKLPEIIQAIRGPASQDAAAGSRVEQLPDLFRDFELHVGKPGEKPPAE